MKKRGYIIIFVMCLSIIVNTRGFANSWVELEPQEVNRRSEIIVKGVYDFSSKPKSNDFSFQEIEFNVTKIYKGDVLNEITVGIDYNDVGWVKDFQQKGGEFLLFLERTEEVNFPIPVGGPNGMIQIVNGEVQNGSNYKKKFYENILRRPSKNPILKVAERENLIETIITYVITGILVSIATFVPKVIKRRES